jgi:23S rRNA pseudouridine1911/1915/1917 synthase
MPEVGSTVALVVTEAEGRPRLDLYLAHHLPGTSRASIKRWILSGNVRHEGRSLKPSSRLRPGDRIVVEIPSARPSRLTPEPIPLTVLHEDEDLLVVVKPAGMVVHPGAGVRSGTLVHALLSRETGLSGIGGEERPGIVHRLDRDTSGLLVVARNDAAHRSLSRQFAGRQVGKIYRALVWGAPRASRGRIEAPLGRHPIARTRVAVRSVGGREAVTEYQTVERLEGFSFLEVRILTGRTHQIRVHLRHLGHAVVGDSRYGGSDFGRVRRPGVRRILEEFGRLALHASDLEFEHPTTAARMRFHAPLPADFERLLQRLRAGL